MLLDQLNRPLRNLRLSVTDRCNLRCQYCMPETEYVWLPREDLLTFEEVDTLVGLFMRHGVNRVRLTGGEPLLRRDLSSLVTMLAQRSGLADLALTTNGILLAEQVDALKSAGLGRITVSLDTLKPDRFLALTRSNDWPRVDEGIRAAHRAFGTLKIDTVVIKGTNEDELVSLIEYGRLVNAEVRFIEYMDVGGATNWSMANVEPRAAMIDRLRRHYGPIEPVVEESSAPADRFRLPDGTIFGIISSTTSPFCQSCDRSRLTADGVWYLCLYARHGIDLRAALRGGATGEELHERIARGWRDRSDRGAEERLATLGRTALVPVNALRKDPHLEMHTRGG